jgi:pyrroline-5-carboxylate reductase
MGKAIISGLQSTYGDGVSIAAYDKVASASASLSGSVKVCRPAAWFRRSSIPGAVIIAVKPQDIEIAIKELRIAAGVYVRKPLWISIAAGVPIGRLQKLIGASARICRVMPNTPALIGKGVSAYSFNAGCTDADDALAEKVLGACGKVVKVAEKLMDAVTGLSGSGPAYVYLFIEALIEGGVTAGLSYDTAKQLAIQTVIGAAEMTAMGSETPSQLKSKVMSPGGTTVRGLMELEKHGFKYGVIRAVTSAARRSADLGRNK